MSFISDVFGVLLRWFYSTLTSLGTEPGQVSYYAMSILMMALISKLITIPLTYKSTKNASKMKDLQPKLQALQKKYGYDERILQQKTMEFYKENNVSMAGCSGCMPMLIQFLLIIALFQVLKDPGQYIFDNPAQFQQIHKNFFWIPDLSLADPLKWVGLPLLNMISQFLVSFMNPAMKQQEAVGGGSSMVLMKAMPLIFYFMSISWSSGLMLYWAAGNLLEVAFRLISGILLKGRKASDQVAS